MLKTQEPYNQLSENDEKALENLCNKITNEGATFCEIGCWLGHSTSIIAKRAKELNGRVICIDTFKGSEGTFLTEYADNNNVYEEFKNNMGELGLLGIIDVFNMDSDSAEKFIKENKLDFLFIDGNHIYEQVNKDINNYLPKMKIGGIISGHDYEIGFDLDLKSITEEDLNKDMSRGFHCGVIKSVIDKFPAFNVVGDRIWWLYK